MVEGERITAFGEPSQFVIMRGEQAAAAIVVMDRLDHRPGNGEPVIGRGAAPDLVEDDEAARRGLRQNGGGLDHFDHEGRATAR
ncbi:hypothetical protein D9M73_181400 [compost metagenome]